MNKTSTGYCLFIFFSFASLFSSCQKKWKKPADVSFNFRIKGSSTGDIIQFKNGYIVVSEIYFKGTRNQGNKTVSLEEDISGNKQMDFFENAPGSGIAFDIPQGTYTQIEIKLETTTDPKGNSLLVKGVYADSLNKPVPVQFSFSAADITSITATNPSGGNTILLVEDRPATAEILMNPAFWFAGVSKSMLNKAERESIGGVPTIVINNDENQSIYTMIVSRLKEGNEVVFN
jgi:hypothetical protein